MIDLEMNPPVFGGNDEKSIKHSGIAGTNRADGKPHPTI